MGRLSTLSTRLNILPKNDIGLSATTTAIEPKIAQPSDFDVYNFVDQYGNVTQIKKNIKERLKFYPELVRDNIEYEYTVIGVSDITPMGCGDIGSSSEMTYAIY